MSAVSPDPFARALGFVLDRLADASLRPGEPVQPVVVAQALRISPTPVREALAHLAGAGLLVRHTRQGYAVPALAASDLIDLFHYEALLLSADPSEAHPLARAELARVRVRLAPVSSLIHFDPGAAPWPAPGLSRSAATARCALLVEQAERLARAVRDAGDANMDQL